MKTRLMLFLVFAASLSAAWAQSDLELHSPVIITSSGQSADAALIEVVLRRVDVSSTLSELLEEDGLAESGANTIIFVMGGSQKGLGAAGIDTEDELARVERLMDYAEANDIMMVGLHVGGEGRRGPLSERFNAATAVRMNLLVVTQEGNTDDYFSELAAEEGIEFFEVPDTLAIGPVLQDLITDE